MQKVEYNFEPAFCVLLSMSMSTPMLSIESILMHPQGVPFSSSGFKHVGTEALIDSIGAGSITIDSSFIERRLRNKVKAAVSVHGLASYKKGLEGVKEASRMMQVLPS